MTSGPSTTPNPASVAPVGDSARPTTGARGFRPELQGLRALAVGLVVVYHVWIGRVSGGVDVFFVISGFLLAGQMTRAAERGTIDLRAYWGKTARRLLAPTAIVLIGVVLASLVILPQSRWAQTVSEVFAAGLFFLNWQLAADSVDYYAAHDTASVVQHMWSLAIQGQFFLLFPVLALLVAWVARRVGIRVRAAMVVALGVLTMSSLVYSVWLTATDQKLAYFHGATRIWEFTLGGMLAVGIERVSAPRWLRILAGWAGVVGLALCGVLLDVQGGFPGYLALWPVVCALAVLAAGFTDCKVGADRFLSSPTMQYVGNISFPLYLWHWPVLLFALMLTRQESLGPEAGLVVIALSLLLAVATRHLVELPIGRVSWWRGSPWADHGMAVTLLVPVLVLALAWQVLLSVEQRPAASADETAHPGAAAIADGGEDRSPPEVAPTPRFSAVGQDWAQPLPSCRTSSYEATMQVCATTPDEPTRRIMVIGDSHMQQFLPALLPYAATQRWQVISILKGACSFGLGPLPAGEDPNCGAWNEAALREIDEIQPDAVVTLASRQVRVGLTEETPPSFVEGWRALNDRGIPVLGVRDNPRYDYSPTECVEGLLSPDLPCSHPRAALYGDEPSYERVPDLPTNVAFLDLSSVVCTATDCPPVIGNVLVYLDDNHLTATYSESMSPVVGPEVTRLLRW